MTYSELAGVDSGRRYFDRGFPGVKREQVNTADGVPYRYVWRQRTDTGYELATMYVDAPYAVTITAAQAALRDRALSKIEFRHPDRLSIAAIPD